MVRTNIGANQREVQLVFQRMLDRLIDRARTSVLIPGLCLALFGCSMPIAENQTGTPNLLNTLNPPENSQLTETSTIPLITATTSPTNSATQAITPLPDILTGQDLSVVFVPEDNELEVWSTPELDQQVIARLAPHMTGITPTHQFRWVNGTLWLEIIVSKGTTGWIIADQVTPQIAAQVFCLDTRLGGFLKKFEEAIKERDGEKFVKLVSPIHGLAIRHEWWNSEVRFPMNEISADIFSDTSVYDWGKQAGSGLPIEGSFRDAILPLLDEALTQYTSHCNSLEQGVAASRSGGFTEWPFEYTNFNYYSLYHPASINGGLDWQTWALGIELLGDQPYVVVMVYYHWEI